MTPPFKINEQDHRPSLALKLAKASGLCLPFVHSNPTAIMLSRLTSLRGVASANLPATGCGCAGTAAAKGFLLAMPGLMGVCCWGTCWGACCWGNVPEGKRAEFGVWAGVVCCWGCCWVGWG